MKGWLAWLRVPSPRYCPLAKNSTRLTEPSGSEAFGGEDNVTPACEEGTIDPARRCSRRAAKLSV